MVVASATWFDIVAPRENNEDGLQQQPAR